MKVFDHPLVVLSTRQPYTLPTQPVGDEDLTL